MNKRLFTFLSIIPLSLSLPLIPVNAAVKAGGTCSSAGITSVTSNKTYTCIKSGKKLAWDKGVAISKSMDQFVDQVRATTFICKTDTLAPAAWKPYQEYIKSKGNACDANFYRYVPFESTAYSGNQVITRTSDLLSIDVCKVKKVNNGPMLGFSSRYSNLTPYSRAKFQVVPIETTDYKTSSTPKKDYGHYFDLLESWVNNNSVNGSTFEIRVPDKYISLNKSLKDYKNIDFHGYPTPEGQQFHKDLISAADPFINFTGTDLIIVGGIDAKNHFS
jgi:hypothetical protein